MSNMEILDRITQSYLASPDFNGIAGRTLVDEFGEEATRSALGNLVSTGHISLVFGDMHPNPRIKALPPEPTDEQLRKFDTSDLMRTGVYPERIHLETVVDPSNFSGRPFELELALGAAQLEHRSFELAILEFYRNDPRYFYQFTDSSGLISIADKYYESDEMPESDQILLESFGVSLDSDGRLYVAAFLRYLYNLSPEHQQIWQAKLHEGETKLHPNYYLSAMGHWPERISMYQAVLIAFKTINEICGAMGRPPLFRKTFSEDDRPKEFSYLLRPTLHKFNDFVHLLDKMVSENLNLAFFKGEIELSVEEPLGNGKVEVKKKGTLKLLQEWIDSNYTAYSDEGNEEIAFMFKVFRKIRKLRQKPAHAIEEDQFDYKYLFDQRDLMKDLTRANIALVSIFASHPAATGVEIDPHLLDGRIWFI